MRRCKRCGRFPVKPRTDLCWSCVRLWLALCEFFAWKAAEEFRAGMYPTEIYITGPVLPMTHEMLEELRYVQEVRERILRER